MTTRILTIFGMLLFTACTESISTQDLIGDIHSPTQVPADGSSITTLSVDLNNDLDVRNVLFKVDKGSFPDNKDADSIIVVAEKIDKQLKAIARFKSPSSPGTITLSIQLVIPDRKGEFVKTGTLMATTSVVTGIDLTANSFFVYSNFDSEITLTGKLFNANHKGVSSGYKVRFDDLDAGYNPVHGSFRSGSLSSDGSSQVSTIYSPGRVDPGQSIFMIVTVLDDAGARTSIADTLSIAITQKN